MSEDINKDMDTVQEIKVKMLAMEEKILLERTGEERKQDKIATAKARMMMNILEKRAQNRDQMRQAGITLQLYKTLIKMHTQKRKECLKILYETGEERDGNGEQRMMGFGEYHHWSYERVLKEQPNYAAYIAMGGGRRGEKQVRFRNGCKTRRVVGITKEIRRGMRTQTHLKIQKRCSNGGG